MNKIAITIDPKNEASLLEAADFITDLRVALAMPDTPTTAKAQTLPGSPVTTAPTPPPPPPPASGTTSPPRPALPSSGSASLPPPPPPSISPPQSSSAPAAGGELDEYGATYDAEFHSDTHTQTAKGRWKYRRGLDKDKRKAHEAAHKNKVAAVLPTGPGKPPAAPPPPPPANDGGDLLGLFGTPGAGPEATWPQVMAAFGGAVARGVTRVAISAALTDAKLSPTGLDERPGEWPKVVALLGAL